MSIIAIDISYILLFRNLSMHMFLFLWFPLKVLRPSSLALRAISLTSGGELGPHSGSVAKNLFD